MKKTKRDFSSPDMLEIFNRHYRRNDKMCRLSHMEPGDNFRIFAKDYYYKEKIGNEVVVIEKRELKEKRFSILLEVVYEPGPKTKIKKTKKKATKKKTTKKNTSKKRKTKKKDGEK